MDILLKRRLFGLTQKELADKLGVTYQTIQNWESGKKIPKSKLNYIEEVFFNIENGLNIVSETIKTPNNIEVSHLNALTSSIMHVPLVNQYAYAGYLSGYGDVEYIENLPKIPFILDKEYKGEYLCFEVKGDSMECDNDESIPEGSILLCRNVRQDYWKNKLHINKWDFVIVHKTDGILVKRIIEHDVNNGNIVLHSLNDYYPDKTINLSDVQQIFNIVEVQQKRKRR